jgi:protocatechuate 3,4-dioxygenase beta subunit
MSVLWTWRTRHNRALRESRFDGPENRFLRRGSIVIPVLRTQRTLMKKLLWVLVAAGLGWECQGAGSVSTYRYEVKVVGPDGRPVTGASVERYSAPEWPSPLAGRLRREASYTSDASGTVKFVSTNRGVFTLVARKAGLGLDWTLWQPGPEAEETSVELVLTAPAAVSGTVQDAAGKPVADAEVWVNYAFRPGRRSGERAIWSPLESQLGRQHLLTRSSADGKFRIDGLPTDAMLDLGVRKPGLALDQLPQPYYAPNNLRFRAGEVAAVLTVKPASVIAGRVVRDDNNEPVAEARVFVDQANLDEEAQPGSRTGPDGVFRLVDLPAGEYRLYAVIGTNRLAERVCEPMKVAVAAGATNRDVKMVAGRGGVLEITVRDSALNQPVKDASVSISRENTGQSAVTAEDGVARLRGIPGEYQLYVAKEGLISHQNQVTLERDQTNRLAIGLEPAPALRGRVLDPDGKPAQKARVSMALFTHEEKRTDSEGRFVLTFDPNRFGGGANFPRIVIARDPVRNLAAALEVDESATNAEVRLGAGLVLAGGVSDPAGKPVPGAEVQVMLKQQRFTSALGPHPERCDTEGRFELRGFPTGQGYSISVSAFGFGRITHTLEGSETNQGRIELEKFQLPIADKRIAGKVVDADDKPVVGAWISSYGEEQPSLSGRTDAKGQFAFNNVCAGPISLSASSPDGGNGNTTVEAGDTNITIQLGVSRSFSRTSSTIKITGSVLDADGKPAPKATIACFPFSNGEKRADADGRFSVMVDPNQYSSMQINQRVLVARETARNLAVAEDIEEGTTNVTLRLGPGLTLVGKVTGVEGKAIPKANVHVTFWTERMGSSLGAPVTADTEGRFEIKGLPPGRKYDVTASAKDFGQDRRSLEPSETELRLELEPLQLLVADQRIAGQVLDDEDKPVARASVYANGEKQPSLNATTDSQGRFSLDKVCAGSIRLHVNSPRGGYGNANVEGGDTNVVVHLSSSGVVRRSGPAIARLKGKPLPELASFGLTPAECAPDKPVLAVLVDAEQRPSRRALKVLAAESAALEQKGVKLIVLQVGVMTEEALAEWKKEAALPFPVGHCKGNPEQARATWGASALPCLILADKAHKVIAEGFAPEEVDVKVRGLSE